MTSHGDIRMNEGEIINALESEFRNEFGNDIDLTESSVFSTFASVLGSVLSENQEQSLQEVYESGFLETAGGEDLNRVVSIIGIQRRSSVHSTGVQKFRSSSPVDQDYTIQKGLTVQTDGSDAIQFETSGAGALKLIDDFESGDISNYNGDTGNFDVVSNNPTYGEWELQGQAFADSHVYNPDVSIREGSEMHFDVRPEIDTIPIVTFAVQDYSNYYQAVFDTTIDEVRIEKIVDGVVDQTFNSASVSIPTDTDLDGEIDWDIEGGIEVTLLDGDTEVVTVSGSDANERWREGHVGFKSGDGNANKYFNFTTTSAVSLNVRAAVGGEHGNVGSNSVTVMPSPPAGVHSTTNTRPIGDDSYTDLDGKPFTIGIPEEADDELRERAKNSVSGGGDATLDAIVNELINGIESVEAVNIYENKTDTDNTDTGGLPPYSFEAVIHGGENTEIAETIFDTKAVTARDYGGAHGTEVVETVTSDVNGQQFNISFSRPTPLQIDLTTDLVVNSTYIGDDKLKDRLVSYVGGNKTDGSTAVGLGVGESVHIDQIKDIIVGGDDTGVIGFDADASTYDVDTTPSSVTENGLEVVSVGENEVPEINSSNITINTREE